MTISERFRQLFEMTVAETKRLRDSLPSEADKALDCLERGIAELASQVENVGEIPQFQLESKLSPVLLKAHGYLDRGRVLLEKLGFEREGAIVWELEQLLYRLLNDL